MTKSTLLVPGRDSGSITTPSQRVPVEVRRIAHARRMRLSFRPERGFLLTCPASTSRAMIAAMLDRAEPWARRVLEGHAIAGVPELPALLHLPARGESYSVDYSARRSGLARDRIRIAAQGDAAHALRLLRTHLRGLAEATFAPRVQELAARHGLSAATVRCGLQRTRWGSCSANGGIRLNSVLLFVAPTLVDHVVLHELAHTRHMDHSPAFRALLARIDPLHAEHEAGLREAWRTLPAWWWQGGTLPGQASAAGSRGQP